MRRVRGDGEYCTYCEREMVAYSATHPTRDHVFPKSKGGVKTVWCCTKCNQAKGDMLPEEWERFMRKFPDWWRVPGREAEGRKEMFANRRRLAAQMMVRDANPGKPKRRPISRSITDDQYIAMYGRLAWQAKKTTELQAYQNALSDAR